MKRTLANAFAFVIVAVVLCGIFLFSVFGGKRESGKKFQVKFMHY